MRVLGITLSLLLLLAARTCAAQDAKSDLRRDTAPVAPRDASLGTVTPTPEMWFYEQERSRQDDPKLAVRRRAELRGQQRQDRLASMQWFGMSNSRPTASPTPWFGGWSPYWGSNTYDVLRWRASTAPVVVVQPYERTK
jgi:hypothetical protein